jgi:outer membrane autotransporter protein
VKKQLTLTRAILSSSIFLTCLGFSPLTFAVLTPVVDGSDNVATPAGAGYNFAGGAAQSFTILDAGVVTNTAGVSFDHTGAGVATLNFAGSSVVSGSIGDYANNRSINTVNLNTGNNANAEIRVQAGNILSGTLNFTHDATLVLENNGQIAKSNITTSTVNTGTIQFLEGGQINGQVGQAAALKLLDFLNQSGGKTLTLTLATKFNDVVIAGDGKLILQDKVTGFAVTNQVNFTGDGLLQFEDGVSGSATNGMITQNHQQGNITFLGSSNLSGNLGTNAKNLNTISIDGVNGSNVQLTSLDIYAKAMTLSNDGTVTFTGAGPINIHALINPTVNNTGEIKTSAAAGVTFNQAIGQLNTLRLFTVEGNTLINSDVKATNTTISNANTLTVNSGKKLESLIDGEAAGQGNLIFNDTNVSYADIGSINNLAAVTFTGGAASVFTLNHDITATLITLKNQETVLIGNTANHSITGNLVLNDTAQLTVPNSKTLQVNGNVTFNAGTSLNYNMANSVVGLAPALTSTGTVALNVASKLNLVSAPIVAAVPIGQTVVNLIQDNSGAKLAIPILTGAGNNIFLNTSLSSDINEINLVLSRLAMAEITPQPHLLGISTVFDQISGQPNVTGELLTLTQQFDNFSNLTNFRSELASITPLIDTANTQIAYTTQQDIFGLFTQRIEELRAENQIDGLEGMYGYNAGFLNQKTRAAWVKVFANHSEQDARDLINGFDATTLGLALGTDLMLTERCLIGIGLTYANSQIHHGLNGAETELNYYQASVYGGVNMTNPWFFNWMAAASYLNYDQNRTIVFGAANFPIHADYNGWQYGARAELGYAFGKLSFHAIPILALSYRYLDIENYTEKGAGTANQHVNYEPQNNLQAEFGVKLAQNFVVDTTLTQPEVHLKTRIELLDDKQKATSQFVSIGPVYDTIGYQPTRESYNAGASLSLFNEAGLVFSVSYDYDFKNDYRAHTGFVRMRYEW